MSRGLRAFVAAGVVVVAALVIVVAPLADTDPDGLERASARAGFSEERREHALEDSPVADYQVRGIEEDRAATVVSGLIGVAAAGTAGGLLVAVLRRRRRSDE